MDAAALTQLIGATGNTPLPAWQHLLGLWQLPADAITVDPAGPCTPASTQAKLHCVEGRSSRLDTLLALDRPLLLQLAEGRTNAWALLLGADARNARLRIGERTVDVDRVLLQSRWNTRYAGLWRGPASLTTPPLPGSSGAAVDWLRQHTAPTGNVAPGAPYDAELQRAVRAMQQARGLHADGVAGPLTLMALASDTPGPQLLRVLE